MGRFKAVVKVSSSNPGFISSVYRMLHPDNAAPPKGVVIEERVSGEGSYELVLTAPGGLKELRTLKGSIDEVLKLIEVAEKLTMFK
ncbi:KEOPS complex subunit Pcc1 [Thermosphaera sp.]